MSQYVHIHSQFLHAHFLCTYAHVNSSIADVIAKRGSKQVKSKFSKLRKFLFMEIISMVIKVWKQDFKGLYIHTAVELRHVFEITVLLMTSAHSETW